MSKMNFVHATTETEKSKCDLWNDEKEHPGVYMKNSLPVTKFYPTLFITLIILLLVSSVSSHLPLAPRELNAKTGSSSSSSSPSSSGSSSSSSSSSKVNVFPASLPHHPQQQEAANILFLPGGSEDVQSSIQSVVPGKPVYEVRIPPSSMVSPYYLTISSANSAAGGKGKSVASGGGGRGGGSSKGSRIRYPVSYQGLMKSVSKGSTPSCITLKSLWRSGKLVLLDSISTDDSSSTMKGRNRGEAIYGRLVPSNQQSESRIDESIANAGLPLGRFGEFAPDEQTSQQTQQGEGYGLDTNHVSLEMNSDSTSKPIVKLSGRSDSYLDEGAPPGSSNSINSMNTGDGSTSSKPGRLSASEFFNAVWHNGPVKF